MTPEAADELDRGRDIAVGRRFATGLLLLACLAGPAACGGPTCQELDAQWQNAYARCDIGGHVEGESCDEATLHYEQCLIFCVQDASCPALRGEDQAEHDNFLACEYYCGDMLNIELREGFNQ